MGNAGGGIAVYDLRGSIFEPPRLQEETGCLARRVLPSIHGVSQDVHEADSTDLRLMHLNNRNTFTTRDVTA